MLTDIGFPPKVLILSHFRGKIDDSIKFKYYNNDEVLIDMAEESEFTEDEIRFLMEETTQEESERIDRIIDNMRGMLIALS